MSVIRVAVPVFRGKRRFHLLKGRPWSPVEHLILQAVATEARTAAALADRSALPKRLVIEALIRLMRADWVELAPQASGTIFRATAGGREKASLDELPNVPKAMTRWMTFVIDRVTGMTFRGRELPIFERHVVQQRAEQEPIVWLESSAEILREEPRAVFAALLEEDETIVDVDAAGDRLAERYALILVRNGKPEGVPRSASSLEAAVIETAEKATTAAPSSESLTVRSTATPRRLDGSEPVPRQISFQSSDLILGGNAHETAFSSLIKRARERVIIHSTFVSESGWQYALPPIIDAARRAIRVDILWGQNEDKPEAIATRNLLADARAKLSSSSLDSLVTVHPFSTNSHAKILVADDGQTGRDVAVVGSCNWLYSGFKSFEASVRLRDPEIVADVLDILSDLSRGRDGLWKPLTIHLATLAQEVRARPRLAGARTEGCLVLGAQHGHFVRDARDRAKKRIFVASHRLGMAAKQSVIIPAVAANAAVVTSQNWLSADPGHNSPLQEVGVFLKGGRIADNIITTFLNARRY